MTVCLIFLTALGSKKCSKSGLVPLSIYQLHTIFEKKRKLLSMEQENRPQFWKNPNAIINPTQPSLCLEILLFLFVHLYSWAEMCTRKFYTHLPYCYHTFSS